MFSKLHEGLVGSPILAVFLDRTNSYKRSVPKTPDKDKDEILKKETQNQTKNSIHFHAQLRLIIPVIQNPDIDGRQIQFIYRQHHIDKILWIFEVGVFFNTLYLFHDQSFSSNFDFKVRGIY